MFWIPEASLEPFGSLLGGFGFGGPLFEVPRLLGGGQGVACVYSSL